MKRIAGIFTVMGFAVAAFALSIPDASEPGPHMWGSQAGPMMFMVGLLLMACGVACYLAAVIFASLSRALQRHSSEEAQ